MAAQASFAGPTPAVSLDSVSVVFEGSGTTPFVAVESASLTLDEHEFVAIVGPTGCGKSTLLNLIAGLIRPRSGRVEVFGKRVDGITRCAGYLFQQDGLMPWKSAEANVAVALQIAGRPAWEARDRARDWLARVGLRGFDDFYPHQLSGGQKKRVALAQTLSRDPKILLMDEPFGPLDAQTRALMADLVLALWTQDKKAVLFVTHDLDEAISLADRVAVMSAGPQARIIAEHRIDLPRPRSALEIRLVPRFHEIQQAIWADLRAEVMRAYGSPV